MKCYFYIALHAHSQSPAHGLNFDRYAVGVLDSHLRALSFLYSLGDA